jgi:predicted anti-sigma-YlaC factor YlaD
MTCRKAKKLMPLYAGDDLRPGLGEAVRAHVDSCPSCRKELTEYRESLSRLKAAAKAESVPDWSKGEWRALAARFRPAAPGEKRPAFLARPRWAAASVLGAFLGLIVLAVLFKRPMGGPERVATAGRTDQAAAVRKQDVVSMTMVSQETGLQIVWFLDKSFEWKGDKN